MRVVRPAGLEDDHVGTPALVDQQGSLPRFERCTHAGKASAPPSASYGNWVGSGRAPSVTSTDRRAPDEDTRSTLML